MQNERIESVALDQAQKNYRKSIEAGLLKILSKMGFPCYLPIMGHRFLKPWA